MGIGRDFFVRYRSTWKTMRLSFEDAVKTMKAADDVEENDKIESALARFFSPEIVDIVCEKCTTGKTATQTAQFTKLPGALILHMKRFVVYEKPDKSFSLRKNAAPVEFGETINLEKFCEDDFEYPAMPRALQFDKSSSTEKKLEGNGKGSNNNNNNNNTNANFSIKSVVHHIGNNALFGHYVTDVNLHNSWTRFNDSVAKESSQAEVFGTGENRKTAYMCVYAYEAGDPLSLDALGGGGMEEEYEEEPAPQVKLAKVSIKRKAVVQDASASDSSDDEEGSYPVPNRAPKNDDEILVKWDGDEFEYLCIVSGSSSSGVQKITSGDGAFESNWDFDPEADTWRFAKGNTLGV
ncbi:hypothetical protein ScalyP_jg3867 [Parmales sp. scaly parma]|nr:hypothetical protein ScalyP_jg3867 [Parmales sp. scaly parma]